MRSTTLLVLAAAAALAPGAVHAQDPAGRPEITHFVQDDGTPADSASPGGFATVVGHDLHRCPPPATPGEPAPPCDHPGLVVTIDGTPTRPLAATPTPVQFHLPETLRLGQTVVVAVSVDGRSAGRLRLRIVKDPRTDGAAPGRAQRLRDGFQVTRFDLVRDAAGSRFVVEGRAPVPDDLSLTVTVRFGKRDLDQRAALVTGGVWRVEVGPYTRPLPLGEWSASALFELSAQGRIAQKRFRATLDHETQEDLARVDRVLPLTLGTPQEIAAQREAMVAHYQAVAGETRRLMEEVLGAYASASRVLFRQPNGGYDAKAHLAHVIAEGAAATPADERRIQADLRFATAAGHLKADAYQAWAEGELLPAWTTSYQGDAGYREATAVPVEPVAAAAAIRLHAIVLSTLEGHARALYAAERLPVPPSLTAPPGRGSGAVEVPELPASERGRRAFDRGRDALLREVANSP
jgi:hypothetical protein